MTRPRFGAASSGSGRRNQDFLSSFASTPLGSFFTSAWQLLQQRKNVRPSISALTGVPIPPRCSPLTGQETCFSAMACSLAGSFLISTTSSSVTFSPLVASDEPVLGPSRLGASAFLVASFSGDGALDSPFGAAGVTVGAAP